MSNLIQHSPLNTNSIYLKTCPRFVLWASALNPRRSDTLQRKLPSYASTSDNRLKTAEPQISWCAIEERYLKINWPWIVSNHNFKQGLHASTPKDLGELNPPKCKFDAIGCVPGHMGSNWSLKPTSLWPRSGFENCGRNLRIFVARTHYKGNSQATRRQSTTAWKRPSYRSIAARLRKHIWKLINPESSLITVPNKAFTQAHQKIRENWIHASANLIPFGFSEIDASA